ncbi:MAG: hypothetical protein ABIQ93_02830 [Saprospiraceae bacterium]
MGLLFLTSASFAQNADSLTLVQTLAIPAASFVTTDNLSNLYVLTADNALEKYDGEGRRLARYSNNRLGPASGIDVTNPLKLLLWYADFRTAVFLDRSLTELGTLSLDAAGFSVVRSVSMSFDGNVWVYDEALFTLKKISPEGLVLFETPPLNQLTATPPSADALREIGNQVYLADQRQGIFVFDQYASWITTWPELPGNDFYVVDDRRYYLSGQVLRIRNARSLAETTILLPKDVDEKSNFRLNEQRLLIWDARGLRVFRIP